MAATKRARVERAMVTAMRVVGDKESEGDDKKDGGGDEGGVQRRRRWRRLIDGDEGDGRATATRVMVTAMTTAKGTTWVMVMVTRLAGDEEGKGNCGKGNGDDNEGGARATERARAARQWRWQQGWWANNGNGNKEGKGNGNKGGRQATMMATKRVMVTAMRVAGKEEGKGRKATRVAGEPMAM